MDLSLRRRHRVTWGVLTILLPLILIVAYAVRPKIINNIWAVAAPGCEVLLQVTEHASYSHCPNEDLIQVVLKTEFRSPSPEIELLIDGKLAQAVEFEGERAIELKLRSNGDRYFTIKLVDGVKDKVFDELNIEI